MMDRREHIPPLPPPTVDKIESFTCEEPVQTSRKKNRNKINKRRFTDEQVKLLESKFETETKLEPRKKVQLAIELGLQPRQVAIWFQNKRARWRSKHIEKEYTLLKADYDNLKSRYESSKKEKQSLVMQLQKLNDQIEQPRNRSNGRKDLAAGNSTDGNSEIADNNCGLEEGSKDKIFTGSDEDKSRNIGNFGLEEAQEIMNKDEQVDGSSASPEKWCRVDACGLLNQPCCDSHWWEFWT